MKHRIFPLGDNAATIDFGSEISAALNERVLRLARSFDHFPFAGLIEIVPAYSSLTVFYEVFTVKENYPQFSTAFAAVEHFAEKALESNDNFSAATAAVETRKIEVPVCFDAEFALDLESIAKEKNFSPAEVIEIFLRRAYRVFMLGFLPGFSYMGEVDEKIAVDRKPQPRLKVPAGSVGIAGRQTGIYSLESPGGWQIIGRTPVKLFAPDIDFPVFFQPGDTVKFHEIDRKTFSEISGAPDQK